MDLTQAVERKTGIIERWMGRYGFIFITNRERYFMPLVEFDAARNPVAGEQVTFEFTVAPIVPGLPTNRNLPVARNVKPVETPVPGAQGRLPVATNVEVYAATPVAVAPAEKNDGEVAS